MRTLALCVFIVGIGQPPGFGQQTSPGSPTASVSLEEVVKLTKAGLSEDIIVAKIKKAGRAFDLTADEILELKRDGVTDAVIKVLVDPTQPYTPPAAPAGAPGAGGPAAPPAAAAAEPKPPADPIALKIPREPGVYYSSDPETIDFKKLELKTLTAARSASKLTKMLKRNVNGYLAGASAKTWMKGPSADLYFRLPEKVSVEEVVLLTLEVKPDRREVDFGPDPFKPVFPIETLKQYSATEIDARLYRVHCDHLSPAQYLLFLLGSGEEKKGILGKGYEFEIRAK
ncbi:MAG: hypothetical protein IT161_14565 [Bryobacterales bacterium]|nr:hypothetical protein [Bryobacterales bacterium]